MCARRADRSVNKVSTEQVLNKAYRLAYFLHQDKATAIRIVAAATLKLNVAMAVQSKRLYYVPVGRFSRGESRRTDGIRNKALFSNLHLLQRLIYVESEPYERQKERAAQPAPPGVRAVGNQASEEDLLVYFIKHLVRITTKRNSFYVTLGVSRLLHSYSTLETMELYNAVIGEPERVKDDYYYRSRKAVLMHEMSQRFDQLIRACRQRRGEERFETQQGTNELRSLMRECLRLFTPWDTRCQVPRDFDPLRSVIASLTSKSSAEENEIEVNRIHAVLHPDCFESLVGAFGYGAPTERMELPRFFSDQTDDQSPPRQRSAPAELNAEELAEINDILAEQARRRRRSSPTAVIRIIVDGIERARLNPAEQSNISFSADEGAEIIEVKTLDASGDLLLATHLLTSFEKDTQDAVVSIRLEGGQYLSFSIARRPIDASGGGDLLVKFDYRETDPRRAARLWWQRLRVSPAQGPRNLWINISPRHILAASLLLAVICLTSYLAYVNLSPQQTGPQISAIQTPLPTPPSAGPSSVEPSGIGPSRVEPSGVATSGVEPSGLEPSSVTPPSSSTTNPSASPLPTAAPIPPKKANRPDQLTATATRSGSTVLNLKLSEVKKVYVEIRGGGASLDDLRSNIVDKLGSSGVVTSTNADEADAALKITISQTTSGSLEASAQLVNARGPVLWPKTGTRRYTGDAATVVSEIMKDLLSAIRQAN